MCTTVCFAKWTVRLRACSGRLSVGPPWTPGRRARVGVSDMRARGTRSPRRCTTLHLSRRTCTPVQVSMVRAVERLRRFGRTRFGSSRKDHPDTFTECHPRDTRRRRTLFEVYAPERTGQSRSTTPTDAHHDRYRGPHDTAKNATRDHENRTLSGHHRPRHTGRACHHVA